VRRDASAFEIKRAWEAARRDYIPEAFPAEVQRDLGDALREIAAIVDEAFRVLRDGAVRSQYLENLKE
jgi:DnaJ-class molecular chaperone